MIDRAQEIMRYTVDLHKDLVEMPSPMPEMPHRLHPAAPDLRCGNRPEPVPPEAHRLMCDIDPALVQQVLHIQERQWIPDIHHHCEADDLAAGLEVAENARVAHPVRLAALPVSGKANFL